MLDEDEFTFQDELMQLFKRLRFERHCPIEHRVEQHSKGPHVHEESFVALVDDDLWCEVSRRAALLLDNLTFLDDLRHSEVANLDSFLAVKQNIVELDVSMDNRAAMDVRQSVEYLFENELAIALLQRPALFNQSQQVAAARILHDHQEVLLRFKDLEQSDHV